MVKNLAARPDSAVPSGVKYREGKDQLSFWVTAALHKRLKAQAKREGLAMGTYIAGILTAKLKEVREAGRGVR